MPISQRRAPGQRMAEQLTKVPAYAGRQPVANSSVYEGSRLSGAAGPLGFVAIEAGWMVTELGRQPWIIYGVMRTEQAVTPMHGIALPFVAFTVIYLFLTWMVVYLLRREFLKTEKPVSAKQLDT